MILKTIYIIRYRNPYSSYFRSDLTKPEREAAYIMEMSWARNNKGGQYDFNDAIFRNEKRYDPTQESVEKKIFNRQKVNEQLQDLFSKNGITIPKNTNLTFTIDPNNFKLVVSGSKDESLMKQIEDLLNTTNNTRELFFHIMKSRNDDSTQFTPDSLAKFHLVNQIKTVTGYNLKDLSIVNGQFVTDNGTNIFDLYKEELLKNPYTAENARIAASHYGAQLFDLAKNGFDSIPDLVLSIGYQNGSLQDIGQKVNYGVKKTID
ncbi:cation efflux system [Bacillus safensis FO-36b] [Bacillus safensis subsp. safensis]